MKPAISAGDYRNRLCLEVPLDARDATGGVERQWVVWARPWARLEAVAGKEDRIAERGEQTVTHRVTIRWRRHMNGGMRFRYGARIFRILALRDPDGLRRSFVCDCQEHAP